MLPLILLVDDEPEILEFLERTLRTKYSVLKAADGKAALKILSEEAVQLVISDVMMPEMDGFELCRNIKSNVEYSHIPVILLTAKNTLQAKIEGLELGADAYIEKPFSREHLLAQMASLLNNRNMIRQYFASSPLVHIKSIAHSRADEKFLEQLNETICKNIEDTDLDVEKLAKIMTMSRITLYRKIKAVSDLTPLELINITRLKKAAVLLAEGDHKIYEISHMVGFSSQSNFARNFLKQFNMTPTDYMQAKLKERV
ncbi:response regulator transcription factor [Flavihumibacter petaseus]|uniref:Putative two-component response regulator n=1 Tax=Flavihumibacter petaseus NBRC 106054 TaxID=1220578 RepID=A0A0E9MVW1_9BACT|nr:response regulator [Flavihumibacter petaseus]GAO41556.1 putative two-component response regulator [Flavihumibacter petaseus NBRC 106054]